MQVSDELLEEMRRVFFEHPGDVSASMRAALAVLPDPPQPSGELEHTPAYLKGLLQRAEDELSATRVELGLARSQLAACGVVARGGDVRCVRPECGSDSLDAVAELRTERDQLRAELETCKAELRAIFDLPDAPQMRVALSRLHHRLERGRVAELPRAPAAKPDSLSERVAVLERDNALLWRFVERGGRWVSWEAAGEEALDARKAGE